MAKFPGLTLTTKGINMIVKSQAGSELIFTKMQLGDGEIGTSEDIKALTALKNACLTANISTIDSTSDSGQIALTAIVSNSALINGFFARELGVWAKIGTDGEEQLYAYSNAGNYTTYIPDKTEPIDENKIKATIVIGNASSVSAVINASIVYVTKEMLDNHNDSTSTHANLMKSHNVDTNAHSGLFAKIAGATFTGIVNLLTPAADDDSQAGATTGWVRSVFQTLLKAALDATGMKYLLDTNGYICFGSLFGGLILQWGYATHGTSFVFPISLHNVYAAHAIKSNGSSPTASAMHFSTTAAVPYFSESDAAGTIFIIGK